MAHADKMEPAIWVGGLPSMPGVRFRVRPLMSSGFSQEIVRRGDRISHSRRVALGKAGLIARLNEIAVDVALDLVIEGWQGVRVDGKSVTYDREAARAAMATQPELLPSILAAAARLDDDQLPGHVAAGMA